MSHAVSEELRVMPDDGPQILARLVTLLQEEAPRSSRVRLREVHQCQPRNHINIVIRVSRSERENYASKTTIDMLLQPLAAIHLIAQCQASIYCSSNVAFLRSRYICDDIHIEVWKHALEGPGRL